MGFFLAPLGFKGLNHWGMVLTYGIVEFDNTVTIDALTIDNAGVLTILAAADMTLTGAFDQSGGGTVSTAGDITTTADAIGFAYWL